MRIDILAAESLGVRGLCCTVETRQRRIVIDPGLALGYQREGLLPHPAQVAVAEAIRCKIIAAVEDATDLVISHFHGDHVPLPDANPHQLPAQRVAPLRSTTRLWTKGPKGLSPSMGQRRTVLAKTLGREMANAEGLRDGALRFSVPMAHGQADSHLGTVMMTRIEEGDTVFVHASDIQLLDDSAVSLLLDWHPDIALVGGPPLYLSRLSPAERAAAWENAKRLARDVAILILDHHLLRSEEGLVWLDRLSSETQATVICAADFAGQQRCLLEARRVQLYKEMPVPDGWHEAYAQGKADTRRYQQYRKQCLTKAEVLTDE
jgi:predicted metallo-beta-lactamase superfamily hydrolase